MKRIKNRHRSVDNFRANTIAGDKSCGYFVHSGYYPRFDEGLWADKFVVVSEGRATFCVVGAVYDRARCRGSKLCAVIDRAYNRKKT